MAVQNDAWGCDLVFNAHKGTAARTLVMDSKRSDESSNSKQHLHIFLSVKRVCLRLEVNGGDEGRLRVRAPVRTERSS
jgi:hypothetical protein